MACRICWICSRVHRLTFRNDMIHECLEHLYEIYRFQQLLPVYNSDRANDVSSKLEIRMNNFTRNSKILERKYFLLPYEENRSSRHYYAPIHTCHMSSISILALQCCILPSRVPGKKIKKIIINNRKPMLERLSLFHTFVKWNCSGSSVLSETHSPRAKYSGSGFRW